MDQHGFYKKHFEALLRQLQQMPVAHSRLLFIEDNPAGYLHPQAAQVLTATGLIQLEPRWARLVPREHPLEEALAIAARALHQAGCTRGWRNEALRVCSADGRPLSRMERTAFRALGLQTQAVHLNARCADGRILLARRALSKLTDPGKWDTLAGGLVNAQDDIESAVLRESAEEAGLQPEQLACRRPCELVVRLCRRLPEGFQVEDLWVSQATLPPGAEPVNTDGEVSEFAAFTDREVFTMIQDGLITAEAALVLLPSLS